MYRYVPYHMYESFYRYYIMLYYVMIQLFKRRDKSRRRHKNHILPKNRIILLLKWWLCHISYLRNRYVWLLHVYDGSLFLNFWVFIWLGKKNLIYDFIFGTWIKFMCNHNLVIHVIFIQNLNYIAMQNRMYVLFINTLIISDYYVVLIFCYFLRAFPFQFMEKHNYLCFAHPSVWHI